MALQLDPCSCPAGPCEHYSHNATGRYLAFRQGTSGLPREMELAYLEGLPALLASMEEAMRQQSEPGILTKAAHLGAAVVRHAAGGFRHATPEVQAERRALCNACPWRDPTRDVCTHTGCGCYLAWKIGMASEACPAGKWAAVPG